MAAPIPPISNLSSLWEVLTLFLIPVGGGIPAGVLLAQRRGIRWPVMMILYFISDVILAVLFEPLMLLVLALGKRSPRLACVTEAFKKSMKKSTAHYGTRLGPFALILVAFGVDPMTGRTVAVAAGHGFLTGWFLAITGDMLFFTLLMVSSIWLNGILGDGTWTTAIIMVVMMIVPALVRLVRRKRSPPPQPVSTVRD